jgi:hypothetical protein
VVKGSGQRERMKMIKKESEKGENIQKDDFTEEEEYFIRSIRTEGIDE